MTTAHSLALALPPPPSAALVRLGDLDDAGVDYAMDARAASTLRAYASDFRTFETWCLEHELVALPTSPRTVFRYLTAMAEAGKALSTISRAQVSIGHANRAAGHTWTTHPMIVELMKGIRRKLGVAQAKKDPLLVAQLARVCGLLEDDLFGVRDRALLSVGFFGAFRRSEIVALDIEDVKVTNKGLVITLRKSKTDQEGRGETKALPYASNMHVCPARALQAWLTASGIESGPIFRGIIRGAGGACRVIDRRMCGRTVACVVQRRAKAAGLGEMDLAGHSLRSGFCTSAAEAGKSLRSIMQQSGHRSERVAIGYVRHASIFTDNAATGLA